MNKQSNETVSRFFRAVASTNGFSIKSLFINNLISKIMQSNTQLKSVMERETISKNRVSPKSQMSRRFRLNINKILLILLYCGIVNTAFSQSIKFIQNDDLLLVEEGVKKDVICEFTNNGTKPLIINSAISNSGGVTVNYPTETIPVGGKGKLNINDYPIFVLN